MRNIFGNSEKQETAAGRGKDEGKERGEDMKHRQRKPGSSHVEP